MTTPTQSLVEIPFNPIYSYGLFVDTTIPSPPGTPTEPVSPPDIIMVANVPTFTEQSYVSKGNLLNETPQQYMDGGVCLTVMRIRCTLNSVPQVIRFETFPTTTKGDVVVSLIPDQYLTHFRLELPVNGMTLGENETFVPVTFVVETILTFTSTNGQILTVDQIKDAFSKQETVLVNLSFTTGDTPIVVMTGPSQYGYYTFTDTTVPLVPAVNENGELVYETKGFIMNQRRNV